MTRASMLLVLLAHHADGYTRYDTGNTTQEELDAKRLVLANRANKTAIGSYQIQDWVYAAFAYFHAFFAIAWLILLFIQLGRRKGDTTHVKFGRVFRWASWLVVVGGMVLHVRHNWFSLPQEEAPPVYTFQHAKVFITGWGFCNLSNLVNAFHVGVKHQKLSTLSFKLVVALVWTSFVGNCVSLIYMIYQVLHILPRKSFEWELHVEMILIGSVLPLYDALNLWCLVSNRYKDWKGHHAMNCIWFTSTGLSAFLLFLAHDAYHVWPYPGIDSIQRLAIQLLPQLAILMYYLPMIYGYLFEPTSKQKVL